MSPRKKKKKKKIAYLRNSTEFTKHGKKKSRSSERSWPVKHQHRKGRKTKRSPTYRLTVKMSTKSTRSFGKYDYHDKKSSAWWTPATQRLAIFNSKSIDSPSERNSHATVRTKGQSTVKHPQGQEPADLQGHPPST